MSDVSQEQADAELHDPVHKRLVEISSSYSGYIGISGNTGLWAKMFEQIERYIATHDQQRDKQLRERLMTELKGRIYTADAYELAHGHGPGIDAKNQGIEEAIAAVERVYEDV